MNEDFLRKLGQAQGTVDPEPPTAQTSSTGTAFPTDTGRGVTFEEGAMTALQKLLFPSPPEGGVMETVGGGRARPIGGGPDLLAAVDRAPTNARSAIDFLSEAPQAARRLTSRLTDRLQALTGRPTRRGLPEGASPKALPEGSQQTRALPDAAEQVGRQRLAAQQQRAPVRGEVGDQVAEEGAPVSDALDIGGESRRTALGQVREAAIRQRPDDQVVQLPTLGMSSAKSDEALRQTRKMMQALEGQEARFMFHDMSSKAAPLSYGILRRANNRALRNRNELQFQARFGPSVKSINDSAALRQGGTEKAKPHLRALLEQGFFDNVDRSNERISQMIDEMKPFQFLGMGVKKNFGLVPPALGAGAATHQSTQSQSQ